MEEKKPIPDEHRIDDLQKDIYSRSFNNEVSSRASLSNEKIPVNTAWEHQTIDPEILKQQQPQPTTGKFFKRIFIISALFFLICAGAAAFIFFGGLNVIANNNVDMTFIGPVAIAAGDELDFDIVIKNNNRSDIVNAELYIDYPDGTKQATDISQDLLHEKDGVGEIPGRSEVKRTIRSVLFGKERSTKEITVTLEYGVKASNALYKKEKTYKVAISSTPLTMKIDHPTQIPSGEDLPFTITIASNSSVPLTDLLVTADYPQGFQVRSSDPEPLDKGVWALPILKPGDTQTITIHGVAQGEENNEKVFRFNVGVKNKLNEKVIATSFLNTSESVVLHRPSLGGKVVIGDSSNSDVVIGPGQSVNGKIELVNNTSEQFTDAHATIVFSGNAFDDQSPQAPGALYRLPTKTMSWDQTTSPSLGTIAPGQKVSLDFSLATLPAQTLANIKNGTISVSFVGSATSLGSGKLISTSNDRIIKVQPGITMIPRLVYSVGPFKNTGPVPPRSEATTTYTVIWTVTRSTNDVVGAEAHGTLPSYVTWLDQVSPATEGLTWIPEKNEVVWHIGDIPGGIAGQASREVAFRVGIVPSFSQIKQMPIIVNNISFKAKDAYTGKILSTNGLSLTTYLSTDPNIKDGTVRP